jgi:hypothetical protein
VSVIVLLLLVTWHCVIPYVSMYGMSVCDIVCFTMCVSVDGSKVA